MAVRKTGFVPARCQERQVRKFNFFAAFASLREIFRVLVAAQPRWGHVGFFYPIDLNHLYRLYTFAYADEFSIWVPPPPLVPEVMESEWQSFLAALRYLRGFIICLVIISV